MTGTVTLLPPDAGASASPVASVVVVPPVAGFTAGTVGLPLSATPVAATSGVVGAASAVATMPAVVGKTNYLMGFEFSGLGSTSGTTVTATLTGLLGGTRSYTILAPASTTGQTTPPTIFIKFAVPVPASGPNVAIVWTVPSLGAGNTFSITSIEGYVA